MRSENALSSTSDLLASFRPMFTGVYTALITPFRNGQLDEVAFKRLVELQIKAGVDGIVPVGTTGESPTLDFEEHIRVIELAVYYAHGQAKVMAGTGSNSTDEAIRLTRWAAKEGADAALMVAPYYNKPTQEGFYQHYRAIAEAVEIPICVYNIPGRTGKNIEPETIIRLAELPTITMVKEATGSLDQASQILCTTDLTLLSGDDSLTLPLLSVGAEGVISVVANIVPLEMKQLIDAFMRDDFAQAMAAHYRLFPLCRDMLSLATNPIPIKAAMAMLGRDTGSLRLPMTELTDTQSQQLRQTLIQFGVLS